jgi:hypothetical protein
MAMLMVKDVFNQTWGSLAGEMRAEFWNVAIAEVKKRQGCHPAHVYASGPSPAP